MVTRNGAINLSRLDDVRRRLQEEELFTEWQRLSLSLLALPERELGGLYVMLPLAAAQIPVWLLIFTAKKTWPRRRPLLRNIWPL